MKNNIIEHNFDYFWYNLSLDTCRSIFGTFQRRTVEYDHIDHFFMELNFPFIS
jgi:hypothetical protein